MPQLLPDAELIEPLLPLPVAPEPLVPEPEVPEPDVPEPDVPEPAVPEPDVPDPEADPLPMLAPELSSRPRTSTRSPTWLCRLLPIKVTEPDDVPDMLPPPELLAVPPPLVPLPVVPAPDVPVPDVPVPDVPVPDVPVPVEPLPDDDPAAEPGPDMRGMPLTFVKMNCWPLEPERAVLALDPDVPDPDVPVAPIPD